MRLEPLGEKKEVEGEEEISDPEVFQGLEIRFAIVEPCCSWALRRKIQSVLLWSGACR